MKKSDIFVIFAVVLMSGCSQKESIDIVPTGEFKLISGKAESKDFAYCSAVIARFGDSAVYAHAYPDKLGPAAFPLIWSKKIYQDGLLTSPTVVQRILNFTDSLSIDRNRLSFYIIAGSKENGLDQILLSIQHYNLKTATVKLDETFKNSEVLRDIAFDSKTGVLQVRKQE